MRKWAKRLGFVFLGLILLVLMGIVALAIIKPWETERPVVTPATHGKRISENGLLGNYYPASGDAKGAVLVVGGSDGGVSQTADDMGEAMAEAGFHTLVLAYWGAPGQRLAMRELPLEQFDRALDWLAKQPDVKGRLAMVGYSKGAEASLLTAVGYPGLKAVVAGAPSHVSWQAIEITGSFINSSSTFSRAGQPIPYLPYRDVNFFAVKGPFEIHDKSLRHQDRNPEAQIAVERIKAPVMLLCGDKDIVWPACPMSEKMIKRAMEKRATVPVLLRYPDAGHGVLGPPITKKRPDKALGQAGGTAEANIAARLDAWPKVIAFLDEALN